MHHHQISTSLLIRNANQSTSSSLEELLKLELSQPNISIIQFPAWFMEIYFKQLNTSLVI
jgi:hypothetical protein